MFFDMSLISFLHFIASYFDQNSTLRASNRGANCALVRGAKAGKRETELWGLISLEVAAHSLQKELTGFVRRVREF